MPESPHAELQHTKVAAGHKDRTVFLFNVAGANANNAFFKAKQLQTWATLPESTVAVDINLSDRSHASVRVLGAVGLLLNDALQKKKSQGLRSGVPGRQTDSDQKLPFSGRCSLSLVWIIYEVCPSTPFR